MVDEGNPIYVSDYPTQELSPAITYGQVVTVSYTDPTTGDDTSGVLQDAAGNDVASFTTGSGGVPAVVNNVPNAAPDFGATSATREVAENSAAGTDVGDPVTATDADGHTLTYTLEGTDAASFQIVSASGQIQTTSGVTYDFETKSRYSVTVKADDSNGGTDTIAVAIDLIDVDETQADTTPPALESATVEPDGTVITLVFDEPFNLLDLPGAASHPFSVTADGSTVTVGEHVILPDEGITPRVYRTIQLKELSSAITYGQTVIVSYTDPTHRRRCLWRHPGRRRQRRGLVHHRLGRRPRRRQQRAAGRDAGD